MIMLCSVGFGGGGICGFVVKVASGVTCGFFVSYCLLWYCDRLLLFGYFSFVFRALVKCVVWLLYGGFADLFGWVLVM